MNKFTDDQRIRLWFDVFDKVHGLIRFGFVSVIIVVFLICTYLTIDSMTGGVLKADINIKADADVNVFFHVLSKIGIEKIIYWVLLLLAGSYGVLQQRLRYRKTKYLQGRIKDLEIQIDPNRTSSGLTETGQTPKEE
ncbi:MAG: hypothetical protein V3V99_04800 [candidate division Zixibacteria bacterium]